jgi:predicted dehydrogenase
MAELKDKYGIQKIYHDYDALLADENVEVVYVALPNHLHYQFAKKAVESKKHVIVEKPFASSYEQAKELVDLARQNHVIIFEAISNQYMPNYNKTKELVKQLGDVKIVQLNYSQYSRRYDLFKEGTVLPVFDPKKSGGALMDLNVYNIHYVVGLFGKPDRIHYIANIERDIDTSGILTMEYPSFQCVCIGAKDCKAPVSINVQGDKGYIHSDYPANTYGSFVFELNNGERCEYALNEGMPRLYHELKTFTDLLKNGNESEAEMYNQHSLDVMEILDNARRQVKIEF